MRNPPAAYKHDDPAHLYYGKSADSSLLSKRQGGHRQVQNFAVGGEAASALIPGGAAASYPVAGAKGTARWAGAGPQYYPAMRAEMSPSDINTFRQNVSPGEFNYFMGTGPAPTTTGGPMSGAAALDKLNAFNGGNNPSVDRTKALAANFGIDINAQPQNMQQPTWDSRGNVSYGGGPWVNSTSADYRPPTTGPQPPTGAYTYGRFG